MLCYLIISARFTNFLILFLLSFHGRSPPPPPPPPQDWSTFNVYQFNNGALTPVALQQGVRKQGWCLMDTGCLAGVSPVFGCIGQGLSKGCSDEYTSDMDCQWIDVTDLATTGRFRVSFEVNKERRIPEKCARRPRSRGCPGAPPPPLPPPVCVLLGGAAMIMTYSCDDRAARLEEEERQKNIIIALPLSLLLVVGSFWQLLAAVKHSGLSFSCRHRLLFS